MNRSKFTGWKDVFFFTLRQTTKGKAFKITTICFALLLFLIVCLVNILTAASGTKNKVSPITTVYVLDESGFRPTDFNQLKQTGGKIFSGVSFVFVQDNQTEEEIMKEIDTRSTTEAVLSITKENDDYVMRLAIPSNSNISKSDGDALLTQVVPIFENSKLSQIGLSEEQLMSINMPVSTSFSVAGGEEESIGVTFVKLFTPMLFSLILYIMVLLYGQSICKSLIAEKSSKLMETLLTSVAPHALIIGKILAMTFLAITQFVLWISSAVAGFVMGDALAKSMYPEHRNIIMSILGLIKDNTDASAFSIPAILLALLAICLGFLFYSVLAGVVGAILNKAEDLSNGMAIYQIPVIISFLLAYYVPLQEDKRMSALIRLIPFTSPFTVPADLVIGNVGIAAACSSMIILLVTTIIFIILTGKLYKGMVLYNGNKLNLKTMFQLLKAK
jgi:ABC-type Na+ efflux pump permease subunit